MSKNQLPNERRCAREQRGEANMNDQKLFSFKQRKQNGWMQEG